MSLVVPFFDYHPSFSVFDAGLLLAVGVVGTLGHFLFTRAFQRATASAIAPFTYMQLVWSTIAGWLVFGTFPDAWTLAGMVVNVLVAAMWIVILPAKLAHPVPSFWDPNGIAPDIPRRGS